MAGPKSKQIPAKKGREAAPVTADPRFARIHSDPRFIRPKKDAAKLAIDSRFSGMLSSKEFGSSGTGPKVDKYGRKKVTTVSSELKRFYKLGDEDLHEAAGDAKGSAKAAVAGKTQDDSEDEGEDEAVSDDQDADFVDEDGEDGEDAEDDEDDDRAAVGEPQSGFDLARGEGLLESSDEEEDDDQDQVTADGTVVRRRTRPGVQVDAFEDEDEDDGINIGPYAEENVPIGDETCRFAVVNLDWDHVKAKDLYKVFDGFRPKTGTLKSVKIFLSDFGKERVEREQREGPPKEIFTDEVPESSERKSRKSASASSSSSRRLGRDDNGEDFDRKKLRKYQIERLRYYYAVVECDSVSTARAIYQSCDGTEFESSANFFDLRYVPDGMTFDDEPTDAAYEAPIVYEPAEFVTQALQHSNVKLTWDEEDPERLRVTRRKFTKDDIKDMDFKAYLASSSDEDEDDLGEGEDADAIRAKYRALLSADDGDNNGFKSDDNEGEDMEITFTAGLSEKASSLLEKRKEEEARKNETVFEAYMRKRREKRKARKAAANKSDDEHSGSEAEKDSMYDEDEEVERGDDPFFKDAFGDEFGQDPSKPASKRDGKKDKKGGKMDAKARKEAAAEEAKSRAELELLLMDDNEGQTQSHSRHFDMKAVLKGEKDAGKKGKAKAKLSKKKAKELAGAGETQDDFSLDVADPRFSAVLESHQFAIDPTNPQFKKTKGMDALLEKRRKMVAESDPSGEGRSAAKTKASKVMRDCFSLELLGLRLRIAENRASSSSTMTTATRN
ncbi:hypothetical protein BC831DRAFT_441650 [Entophlyctis helioformis]|nr:hypothetical protein BC831DRAFT_441650 [Entophlyctis helioformis]